MGVLWNHWFWVTLNICVICTNKAQGETLNIDSAGQHLTQAGEWFPPGRESSQEKVSVSQSSSVSKVSVKFGGISLRQKEQTERSERSLPISEKSLQISDKSLPVFQTKKKLETDRIEDEVDAKLRQSFFQRLLSKLQSLSSVRVHNHLRKEMEDFNTIDGGYQLVYRDGDIEEYLEYDRYGVRSYSDGRYSDYIEISGDTEMGIDITGENSDKDDIIIKEEEGDKEDEEEEEKEINEDTPLLQSTLSGNMEPRSFRIHQARARSLIVQKEGIEDEKEEKKDDEEEKEKEENIEDVWNEDVSVSGGLGVTPPNMDFSLHQKSSKGEVFDTLRWGLNDMKEEEIIEDVEVIIDPFKVENLTFRNKIVIFIGVIMIVLTITVILGMVAVSVRRVKRGKRRIKEEVLSYADTVSTVMKTGSFSGVSHSLYSNYIMKSSLSCDELTELDNDSFLTSLETISVMERFGWD